MTEVERVGKEKRSGSAAATKAQNTAEVNLPEMGYIGQNGEPKKLKKHQKCHKKQVTTSLKVN